MTNKEILSTLKAVQKLMDEHPTWGDNVRSWTFFDDIGPSGFCGLLAFIEQEDHDNYVHMRGTILHILRPFSSNCETRFWFNGREERLKVLQTLIKQYENEN